MKTFRNDVVYCTCAGMILPSWERPLPYDRQDFVLENLQDVPFQQMNLFKLPAALPKKAERH